MLAKTKKKHHIPWQTKESSPSPSRNTVLPSHRLRATLVKNVSEFWSQISDYICRLFCFLTNCRYITKTCLYNFQPLKPHFYSVKLGFIGVYIIFLISAQNIDCGYSLEPPHQRVSTIYVLSRNKTNIIIIKFYLKIFSFWRWFCSLYLNRSVFVMGKK